MSLHGTANRGTDRFPHADQEIFIRRGGVFSHVDLDSIGDGDASPREHRVLITLRRDVRFGRERRLQGCGDSAFQRVARDAFEFLSDGIERLPLPLPNLDGEELQEMPVVICGRRPGPFRAIQQPYRDVEPYRPRTRRRARGRVGRAETGGVYETGGVGGEPSGVPRGVFGMGAEESNRRFSHVDRITLNSSARSS